MKKRGRLHDDNNLKFEIVKDVAFTEATRFGKTYTNWFEETEVIGKKEMIKRLAKKFGLKRDKAGLLLSWSIRDGSTPNETYSKFKARLISHQR